MYRSTFLRGAVCGEPAKSFVESKLVYRDDTSLTSVSISRQACVAVDAQMDNVLIVSEASNTDCNTVGLNWIPLVSLRPRTYV